MIENIKPNDVPESFIKAVYKLIARMAHADVMRQEVDKIKASVLKEIELYDYENKRILIPDNDWLGYEHENYALYEKELQDRIQKSGLKPDDMPKDFCPALVAEHDQIKAEWAVFDEAARLFEMGMTGKDLNNKLLCGTDEKGGLELRQEFLDNCIGLVLQLNEKD